MPAAITTPYSLELAIGEDAKDATVGSTVTPVTGKLKIFMGVSVTPGKMQSIAGSSRAVYRRMMEEVKKGPTTDVVGHGQALSATSGNITVGTTSAGYDSNSVVVLMDSAFATAGNTHAMDETFNQLINVLLEKSTGT